MRLRIKRQAELLPDQDWSSISDIGREFGGKELSQASYLQVEDMLVDFAATSLSNALPLEVRALENPGDAVVGWRSGMQIKETTELRQVIIDCLRERYWCKLENQEAYLHFGYDMILYIGVREVLAVPNGLRIDEMESPYSEPT